MGATGAVSLSALELASAYVGAQGARTEGEFASSQYKTNAQFALLQAGSVVQAGESAAQRQLLQGELSAGSSKASFAAQGVSVATGSPAEVMAASRAAAAQDAETIRNNAWREAWGLQAQAVDYMGRARLASLAGQHAATNTLLTGGLRATGRMFDYYNYTKKPVVGEPQVGLPGVNPVTGMGY